MWLDGIARAKAFLEITGETCTMVDRERRLGTCDSRICEISLRRKPFQRVRCQDVYCPKFEALSTDNCRQDYMAVARKRSVCA
jgi:hypothetical protein